MTDKNNIPEWDNTLQGGSENPEMQPNGNDMPDVIYADGDNDAVHGNDTGCYSNDINWHEPYIKKSTIGAGIDRGDIKGAMTQLDGELDFWYDISHEANASVEVIYKAAAHLLELMDRGE